MAGNRGAGGSAAPYRGRMTETTTTGIAPAPSTPNVDAVRHFAAKLRFETDASDVVAALAAGERLVLVDTRSREAWDQGHAAPAVHLPRQEVAARALAEIPLDVPVVVYCWSPGCNGADKAALEFARLGYEVRLMIGGFEYWAREGCEVEDANGPVVQTLDPLVGPVASADCGC